MTNSTKQAEWPKNVTLINESHSDKWMGFGSTNPNLCAIPGVFGVEYIRADLVKRIQVDQKFKPVLYARFRNGEIDWAEDCVSSDNACADDYIEHQSDDEFYESAPLYSADTVRAMQLEAIRKTLEVAEEYRSDGRKFKTIDPEEILNSLGE